MCYLHMYTYESGYLHSILSRFSYVYILLYMYISIRVSLCVRAPSGGPSATPIGTFFWSLDVCATLCISRGKDEELFLRKSFNL